jgi:hypothetical protein
MQVGLRMEMGMINMFTNKQRKGLHRILMSVYLGVIEIYNSIDQLIIHSKTQKIY